MSRREQQESKGKIRWILESAGLSGGVRIIFEMNKRLKERGWDTGFLSLDEPPKWMSSGTKEWTKFANYPALITHAQNNEKDAKLIANWWRTAFALQAIKLPGYYLVQDDESFYYSSFNMKDYARETYGMGLKMFTTSHWVEENIFGTTYVGIGVETGKLRTLANHQARKDIIKKRRIMAIGRRQSIKGFSYLAEVVQRASHELAMPSVIVGVDQGIQFSGTVEHKAGLADEQMAKEFVDAEYFVNCSYHEGWGIPNLEAMAAGAVVVTTDCDGIRDFCVDGENSLIVSRTDPREMIAALAKLDVDKDLRAKLIAGGKKTAEQWPWKPVIDRLEAVLVE